MGDKKIKYDIDGYEVISKALMVLVNQYPGLSSGDSIAFTTLPADGGKALQPITSAIIETERTTITGHVSQVCLYPFQIWYRTPAGLTDAAKISAKEWLDNLGRWLEGHKVVVDGEEHQLKELPPLTGDRKFLSIERSTPAYPNDPNDNQTQDWTIQISARYQYEFDKITSFKSGG